MILKKLVDDKKHEKYSRRQSVKYRMHMYNEKSISIAALIYCLYTKRIKCANYTDGL